MQTSQKTLLETLDQIPPPLMFALARKRGKRTRITVRELADITKIPERTLMRIAAKLSWKDVPLQKLSVIADACNVNFMKMEETVAYLRRNMVEAADNPFPHLLEKQRKRLMQRMAAINQMADEAEEVV